MILTAAIQQKIVEKIRKGRLQAVMLPEHAYGRDGRVVVLVDGIPIDLHRHLHNIMIRPLGHHERMWQVGPRGNVNPYLFAVVAGDKSPRTHCNKGHAYAGNEAPPNTRGYRCLTCYRDSYSTSGAIANRNKTHCPQKHEYTVENTVIDKDGRRHCRTCKRESGRNYMRKLRSIT